MLKEFEKQLVSMFEKAGAPPAAIATPPKPEMGDAAYPCFEFAKKEGKNPAAVAADLALKVKDNLPNFVADVKAFGPYVNLFFKADAVVEFVMKQVMEDKENYGSGNEGRNKKIIIEYPSNNTHKEFHVGHFRNVCIGNSLVKLYEKNGYKVYPVNYLNDFGSHVAKCLWGLQKFHAGEKPPADKQKWLGEIYAESSRYLKDHPEFADEVADLQKKLEAKDKRIWPVFLRTRRWSIEKFQEIFKELKVKHVKVFYEKDLKREGQKTVDMLLKKGVAKVGEGGAIIVDLSSYGLDIALVRKSNGAGLYLTSDLPLAEEKFKKIDAYESIVITGEEQKFYFKQLYKILELIGVKKKLTHLSYGLVNLPEGKMSSRTGNVILYEDIKNAAMDLLEPETKVRHPEWTERKVEQVTKKIALAALKFDMQKHEAQKNIVFDVNEATSFEGFSGPYVLYTIARVNSILKRAKKEKIKPGKNYGLLISNEEKKLALMLGNAREVMLKALKEYNPSVITRYSFELAQAFSEFYNKHSIIKAENREIAAARLSLASAVKQVLQNMLETLTIDSIEEM